jgi:Molybdopterin-guanine dinucleotide biosynthesis protein A
MRRKRGAGARWRGCSGAVLAGGVSRRMGRDKAMLRVGGEPLWRRQVRVLREAGAEPVAVVRRVGQKALGGEAMLWDAWEDAGPLAGVEAALRAAKGRWVAVLAVDMPGIDAAWFRWLRGFCTAGCGAVVRHAEGSEPLAAIYPREALAVVSRRLRDGRRSMQELVTALARGRRVRLVQVTDADAGRWRNWNTPEDRRRG